MEGNKKGRLRARGGVVAAVVVVKGVVSRLPGLGRVGLEGGDAGVKPGTNSLSGGWGATPSSLFAASLSERPSATSLMTRRSLHESTRAW